MNLAGDYASACHHIIHKKIAKQLGRQPMRMVENHHNFAWKEKFEGKDVIVHRKGATPAGKDVLGIIPKGDVVDTRRAEREAALIEMLITMRAQARAAKNYAESDRIRKELAKVGVLLDDRADGTLWRVET